MSDTQFGKIKTNYIVTKYKGMPENKPEICIKLNVTCSSLAGHSQIAP